MNGFDYEKMNDKRSKAVKNNKDSYNIVDGVKYINIMNNDTIIYNVLSICEVLNEDLGDFDHRIGHLKFSVMENYIIKLIKNNDIFNVDKKIKDWIIRNYKRVTYDKRNNKELNKMIRNNYFFYFKNDSEVYYM